MPAKVFRFGGPCRTCEGKGFSSFCSQCGGSGRVVWGECWGCGGTGGVKCEDCCGRGVVDGTREVRTWVPDSKSETEELLAELEEAITAGENGWILVNSLRRGYAYSDEANRWLCFPQEIIERIRVLEKKLPPPCPACNGQGTRLDFGGATCPNCRGKGSTLIRIRKVVIVSPKFKFGPGRGGRMCSCCGTSTSRPTARMTRS
jgi:DnaJ-class molecular chaperone